MEDLGCDEPTKEAAGAIRPIDKTSVHQICSGQVILTLATAVKELVENSLDAGATNIEVRLKEHGTETVEVIDNGSGVEEKNYEALTLKHYTSKLASFSDLVEIETFGFRGEALSSLCALSKLTITTSCSFDGVGTRLEFDHGGKLVSKKPCARQHGTSVLVEQLFSTLPVRHKEFQRNIKKEFAKMVQTLNAYCIINTGVKLTCTNHTGNGKKSIVLSVMGNSTMRENIADIYGLKQLQGLLEIKEAPPDENVLAEYDLQSACDDDSRLFSISGLVSSCEHGSGRSSTDRQFYFINKRPCDPQKISRLVNEVYHMFNRHQYPMVVLDITLAKDLVDVNVTPDKRQIFVQHEKLLLATVKTSLMKMFMSLIPISSCSDSLPNVKLSFSKAATEEPGERKMTLGGKLSTAAKPKQSPVTSILNNLKRSFKSAFDKSSAEDGPGGSQESQSKQIKIDTVFTKHESSQILCSATENRSGLLNQDVDATGSGKSNSLNQDESAVRVGIEIGLLQAEICTSSQNSELDQGIGSCDITDNSEKLNAWNDVRDSGDQLYLSESSDSELPRSKLDDSLTTETFRKMNAIGRLSPEEDDSSKVSLSSSFVCMSSTSQESGIKEEKDSGFDRDFVPDDTEIELAKKLKQQPNNHRAKREDKNETRRASSRTDVTATEFDTEQPVSKKVVTIKFSLETLKKKLERQQQSKIDGAVESQNKKRSFHAGISPSSNEAAENELKKELRKDMFEKMQVIGQFNLGFMIAQLNRDLFIVDQHATDEKFNFEQLEKNTVLVGQRLIQPQKLQLTAVNESILSENLEVFLKNGFEFTVNETAPPGDRILLQSIPTSKNWLFGKDDIEEMIFMLSETPGVMCRPSRIRQMLASRACRSSVMIGTALTKSDMKKLIVHMGEIEQPWNCPHGRPTIRHLINLDMVVDRSESL